MGLCWHGHGAGNQPSGMRDAGACNTQGDARMDTHTHISIPKISPDSFEGEITFSFTDFQKSTLHFFFFLFFYTCMPLHPTTACTFARPKKHVIKLRDARVLPFLPSLLLERQIANQNLHLNRIFLMYESGRPEGKEVLHSLTICTKLHLKCDTMF